MSKTWSFKPESKLIRFYKWCWAADERDLNFCKLFWGILFSPIAIILRYPVKGLYYVIMKLEARHNGPWPPSDYNDEEGFNKYLEERRAWEENKRNRSNSFFRKLLGKVSSFFSRYGERIWHVIIIGYVVFLLGWFIYAVIRDPWFLMIIPAVALMLGLIALLHWAADRGYFGDLGRKIKDGFRSAVRFISDGYHHTKDKTCPIIIIEKENDNG